MDTGDLLLQQSLPIDNSVTTGEALSKLSFLGADLVIKTLDAHNIFGDFTQLTTFLIPRSELPPLPPEVERQLGFFAEKDIHHA